jgi:adenosylcobinamide-GDP ribazoletransferase
VKTDHPAWSPPLLALQFLTRIPVPGVSRLTPEQVRSGLARSVIWFPLVGTLIGAITAAVLLLSEQIWPRLIAVLIALIVEARLTGAFHEDAVADFCDAVGGGRDQVHVRSIMKDSRIGSYGALGLLLALPLRAALIFHLPATLILVALLASATGGRLMAVFVMRTVRPAPVEGGLARDIAADVDTAHTLLAVGLAAPALLALAYSSPWALLSAAVASLIFLFWFRVLLLRRVGGSTGDCLGFAAYMGQLIFLLAAVAA